MKEIIVHNKPKSPISEAYRSIRTNIQFANVDNNMKTILVTSSTPGEGKTTTLLNLATTMAQNKSKVLVIDCDMRKPRVHKALMLTNKKGLSELLLSKGQRNDYIQRVESLELDVLTAGQIPSNPSELLSSKSMRDLLDGLKPMYDYILLDTPPVIPVTDATIMSSYIDGVVLVVTAGGVDRELVQRAKEALLNAHATIVGVVLNRIKVRDTKAYNSYYYYYADDDKASKHKESKEAKGLD